MNGGTVSARRNGDTLDITCSCGDGATVPATGGTAACRCGMVHRYDGKALLSTPDGQGYTVSGGTAWAAGPQPDPRNAPPRRGGHGPL